MAKPMTKRERFFYDHAGFSYDPQTESRAQGKRRCAANLARAEEWREQQEAEGNLSVEWLWDDHGCAGCDCGSQDCACATGDPHETLGCVLRLGSLTESLWGICGAGAKYRRVIEAELAAELMDSEVNAIARAVPQF